MAELAPSRHATELPSPGRKGIVWTVVLVAAIHSLLVMLWVMPPNPIREAVGQEGVAKYINNEVFAFEQSWSVFAPVPRRGGENVVVQAFIGDPKTGEGKLTNPFDITADEDARIKYLVNPSRIHSATRRLGGNINSSMPKLSAQQQLLTRGNYVETDPKVLYNRMAKLTPTPVGKANVYGYSSNDQMMRRYLTMYATARWGKGVSMIKYKVGHRSVPNYSKRKDVNFLDVPFTYYTFGWRKPIPASGDAQAAFDRYVTKAPPEDYVTVTKDSKGKLRIEKGDGSP